MYKKRWQCVFVLFLGCLLMCNTYIFEQSLDLNQIFEEWENGITLEEISINETYLKKMEQDCNNLRQKYLQYADNPENKTELLPSDQIKNYRFFYESDEEIVEGYISLPNDYMQKEYPVLIFNRGGNTDFSMSSPEEFCYYARYGFISLGTEYRGSANSTGVDEFGGADVNDVIRVVDLAEIMRFSNGKIYMFGWSRGAMETYIVLKQDSRIDAAVVGAGPTDMLQYFKEEQEMRPDMALLLGMLIGNPAYNKEAYEERSALCFAEQIDTPLYIVHGTEDERVPFHNSEEFYERMKALGKDVKFKACQGQDHVTPAWAYLEDYFYWLRQY